MRDTVFIVFFLLVSKILCAQNPQFAVVRPDGATYICPTFDSALIKAVDDDFIYLPGANIVGDKTITKRLTLIGTGHYPDSTIYTGKTLFMGNLFLGKKCTLEGFECAGITISNSAADSCSFIRIKTSFLDLSATNYHFIDGSVFNVIQSGNPVACNAASNILIKNSILAYIQNFQNSDIKNCIFQSPATPYQTLMTTNCTYTNCVFLTNIRFDGLICNNPLVNTVNNSVYISFWFTAPPLGQNNIQNNQPDTIFVSYTGSYYFQYYHNYHLRPGSPYLTAGDDGLQIGVYGNTTPYKEGAVPSNPHIYFKQVSAQSNTNGQLPVQFKVRTNN